MPIKIGVDLGNSESVLAWGTRDRRTRTLPSYLGSGSMTELQRMRHGGRAEGSSQEIVLTEGGVDYFVGDLAIRQSADADSGRGDVGRYWSGHTKRLLLTLCGQAWPGQHQQLYVVTGLPVAVWSETNVSLVAQNLMGTHEYALNDVDQKTTVKGVLVVMEGAGASAQLGGEDAEEEEATLDIGGRTTIAYWTRAQEPVIDRSGQLSTGVEKITDNLARYYAEHYEVELELWQRRALLRHFLDTKNVPHPKLTPGGVKVNLLEQLTAEVRVIENEITSFVKRKWRSSEKGSVAQSAARVNLVGGGAYFFGSALKRIIPRINIPKQPELQNALGYLTIAQSITDSEWAELAADLAEAVR